MADKEDILPWWTTPALKEYVDRRMDDHSETADANLAAIQQRLNSMDAVTHQLSHQLSDLTGAMLPRNEYAARHDQLINDINILRERTDKGTGGAMASQRFLTIFMSIASLIISASTIIVLVVVH